MVEGLFYLLSSKAHSRRTCARVDTGDAGLFALGRRSSRIDTPHDLAACGRGVRNKLTKVFQVLRHVFVYFLLFYLSVESQKNSLQTTSDTRWCVLDARSRSVPFVASHTQCNLLYCLDHRPTPNSHTWTQFVQRSMQHYACRTFPRSKLNATTNPRSFSGTSLHRPTE